MKNPTSLKPPLAFRFQRPDNTPENQYKPVIMPGLLSERNSSEFCYGVKVELIKCRTTLQFKFIFNSLLGNIFKHKINQHIQLFLSFKSVKTVYIRNNSLFDELLLMELLGRFITDT